MCAKQLRKMFPSLHVIPTHRFAKSCVHENVKLCGFHAYRQEGKIVERLRVVLRNKYYVYIVPEREFERQMKGNI